MRTRSVVAVILLLALWPASARAQAPVETRVIARQLFGPPEPVLVGSVLLGNEAHAEAARKLDVVVGRAFGTDPVAVAQWIDGYWQLVAGSNTEVVARLWFNDGRVSPGGDCSESADYMGDLAAVVWREAAHVDDWQIDNEPDLCMPPGAYARRIGQAWAVIREKDPGARIVTGGLAFQNRAWAAGFLGQLRQEACWPWCFDLFAVHSYDADPGAAVRQARRLLEAAGAVGRVALTEFGCCWGRDATKAEMVNRFELAMASAPRMVIVYRLQDQLNHRDGHFGLWSAAGQPKVFWPILTRR